MKLRRYLRKNHVGRDEPGRGDEPIGYEHFCPGCNQMHPFAVDQPFYNGAKWSFDGNMDSPTFNPSMNIRVGPYPSEADQPGRMDICHYYLHGGVIQYLGDCTHEMKNQKVPLPDIPQKYLIGV